MPKSRHRKLKGRSKRRKTSSGAFLYSDRFVLLSFYIEKGIHESSVMEPDLKDKDVIRSLEKLVSALSAGTPLASYEPEDLISLNIRRNLEDHAEQHGQVRTGDLLLTFRRIIESVRTHTGLLRPRGYLDFIAGFLKQAGVKVRLLTGEEVNALGLEELEDDESDSDR
jgi:hypothetical protein